MEWLRLDVNLPSGKRIARLRQALGLTRQQAVGAYTGLLCFVGLNSDDGDISWCDDAELAAAMLFDAVPEGFRGALVASGVLTPEGSIHGWTERQGYLLRERERKMSARAARQERALSAETARVERAHGARNGRALSAPQSIKQTDTQKGIPKGEILRLLRLALERGDRAGAETWAGFALDLYPGDDELGQLVEKARRQWLV